jgi:hypothetical protein
LLFCVFAMLCYIITYIRYVITLLYIGRNINFKMKSDRKDAKTE